MGLLGLLRSIDELLYELVSWLLFFPLTLWRALVRPAHMMDHAKAAAAAAETAAQLQSPLQPQPQRYLDAISPPLFLFLALLLAHVVELVLVGPSEIVQSTRGANALVDTDTNLVIMRALMFSVFPLAIATWLLVRQKVRIDRDTLRPPFYSQCYAAGAFALFFSLGLTLTRVANQVEVVTGALLFVAAPTWFLAVQVRWFARHLRQSTLRSLADAIGSIAVALGIVIGVGSVFT